ncbi:unnamed protein product, partial [Prorocentrum cordatum]
DLVSTPSLRPRCRVSYPLLPHSPAVSLHVTCDLSWLARASSRLQPKWRIRSWVPWTLSESKALRVPGGGGQDDSGEAEGEEPAPAVQEATAEDTVMTKSAPTAAPAES